MTAVARLSSPLRRGACPGVVDAMESADGWLMRVRLPGGAVSPAGVRTIARVAGAFGSGEIAITSRANVQIRGIGEADLGAAAEVLIAAGLALADPTLDARRGVVVAPLAGHDPTELLPASEVAAAVLDALAGAPLHGPLPAKFGVVIDGGGRCGVRQVPGHVCLGAVESDGPTPRWQLALGSSLDADTSTVRLLPASSTAAELTKVVVNVAVDLTRQGCLADVEGLDSLPIDEITTVSAPDHQGTRIEDRVGRFAHPHPDRCNLVAGAFLGRLSSAAASAVADLVESVVPTAEIRTAPSGRLALVGVSRSKAAQLTRALSELGLSCDPTDARHLVSACVGSPGCASARAETTDAARGLASDMTASGPRGFVHLSGCEKLCGAPADATILVADNSGRFVATDGPR